MQEIEVFHFNELLNDRGVGVDRKSISRLVAVADELMSQIELNVVRLTNGKVKSATAVAQTLTYIRNQGVNIPNLKAETLQAYLSPPKIDELPDDVRELLEHRQVARRSSVSKFIALQETISSDDRIHGLMYYNGAHTGRWSSKLVQLQNLPRGIKLTEEQKESILSYLHYLEPPEFLEWLEAEMSSAGSPVDILASMIRPMIWAKPNHKLIVYDYSSIEARVLAWLAGCKELIQAFEKDEDVYKLMASKIYGKPVSEIAKDSPERQLGKAAVLGCGYGMGWQKFQQTMAAGIDEATARFIVHSYRESLPEIVSLWNSLDVLSKDITKQNKFERRASQVCPSINFYKHNSFVFCGLPSGRELAYPFMECKLKVDPVSNESREELTYMGHAHSGPAWVSKYMYGAKLVENIVQATARDLMVAHMLQLEAAGFPVIFSVHDEVVCEVPDFLCGTEGIQHFETIMTTPPEWATGLPLSVDGYVSQRYRK
jgi:DNA polymerase